MEHDPSSHAALLVLELSDFLDVSTISSRGVRSSASSIENLVGHEETPRGDYRRDGNLQGIRTVIARVAARGGLHALGPVAY